MGRQWGMGGQKLSKIVGHHLWTIPYDACCSALVANNTSVSTSSANQTEQALRAYCPNVNTVHTYIASGPEDHMGRVEFVRTNFCQVNYPEFHQISLSPLILKCSDGPDTYVARSLGYYYDISRPLSKELHTIQGQAVQIRIWMDFCGLCANLQIIVELQRCYQLFLWV